MSFADERWPEPEDDTRPWSYGTTCARCLDPLRPGEASTPETTAAGEPVVVHLACRRPGIRAGS